MPHHPEADTLESYWYALIWGSVLIPVLGGWAIVVVSSVMHYTWRRAFPAKARSVNLHGWMAFGTGQLFGCLLGLTFGWPGGPFGGYGERLPFNHGDFYFTSRVSRADAERLRNYLGKAGHFDGGRVTVQLDKERGDFLYRMAVPKGVDQDPQLVPWFRDFALELSTRVFDGAPVDLHLCDDRLNTLRVVVMPRLGIRMPFQDGALYRTPRVTAEEVARVGDLLVRERAFADGRVVAQIDREAETYLFRMLITKGFEHSPEVVEAFQQLGRLLSREVFAGEPVEIHLCDSSLETLRVVMPAR